MPEIIEYPLGQEAIEYIKKFIHVYGRTLSRLLLDYLDLDTGTVIGLLPTGISAKQANGFEYGGLPWELSKPSIKVHTNEKVYGTVYLIPLPETTFELITRIEKYLGEETTNICVLENNAASPNDPWLRHAVARIRIHDNDVYAVLFAEDIEVQNIWNAIRDTGVGCLIGIMTSQPPDRSISDTEKEFSMEQILTLAKRTKKKIVGAYDFESYLIWSRE